MCPDVQLAHNKHKLDVHNWFYRCNLRYKFNIQWWRILYRTYCLYSLQFYYTRCFILPFKVLNIKEIAFPNVPIQLNTFYLKIFSEIWYLIYSYSSNQLILAHQLTNICYSVDNKKIKMIIYILDIYEQYFV